MEKKDLKSTIDFGKYICSTLFDQIKLADTKATWVVSGLGVTIAALFAKITRIDWTGPDALKATIFLGVGFLLFLISFKEVMSVIFPRIGKGSKDGLLYFRDITSHEKQEYIDRGMSLSDTDIAHNYYEEAFNLSSIVNKKFQYLRVAMITALIFLIWALITIFYV